MADVSTDWVRLNARRFGSAPALRNIETDERYTWAELDERVGRLAGVLASLGVGDGDRVLLLAEGDTRTFEMQFACMRLGAVMVPLNWRLALPELIELAADAEPAVVVHDDVWRDSAERIAEAVSVPVALSWRCDDSATDYDKALAGATPVEPRTDLPLDRPTHILHTSGTTGMPKGAITTAKSMTWQTFNTAADALLTGPGCVHLNPMPLFHAGGLTTVSAPMLLTGGCVATMRRFEPEAVAGLLSDPAQGITHFTAPPVMWLMLSQQPTFADGDFGSLRFAQVAGGVPPLELLDTWNAKGVLLRQAYGGTELGPAVTTMPADEVYNRPASCGRAVPFTNVRLVAPEGGDVAQGEVGEVWIKGPSVTPGYWRRDSEHDGTFVDGWFRTGDAAWCDEDGFYYLVDRFKDMYKSGGENVAPAEVERVLGAHPDIVDVAVIGVADEKWGEVGKAFVVAREGATLSLESLREFCAERIAKYKAPHHLVVVDSLPRNTTGKIVKARLRELG
ncbi:MAG: fatty-acyl-CoA synthase [Pseudonocardiales bacterium]|nr:fatty-acyl-CoA synthase [Pseudonocardiales bacterium]